jgi:type 1 glutamine amidotransferase
VDIRNIAAVKPTVEHNGTTPVWYRGSRDPRRLAVALGRRPGLLRLLGHQASDFDVALARVIVERGLLWAAGRSPAAVSVVS